MLHLQLSHKSLLKFACGEPGCFAQFDALKNFKGHLRKIHNFSDNYCPQVSSQPQQTAGEALQTETNDNVNCNDPVPDIEPEAPQISVDDVKAALAAQADAFVSKLYSKPSLPRSYVQHIVDDADVFLGGGFLQLLKEKCLTSLHACKAGTSGIQDIQKMFEVLQEPMRELKTEHRRLKRFKASGNYIPPVPYRLGVELANKRTRDGQKAEWVPVQGQHFPLRESFKKFLELPNCLDDILTYTESLQLETETISNFMQGELWKLKLQKFSHEDTVLPIFIFFDDFECNNALGPNSGKLGGVYATLPCLPPECRSALDNIFLSLLFNSKDREEFSNKKTLEPLIQELKYLETNGILVKTKDGEKRIFFCLGLVIGDNLGVHQICGFVEGFKANFPCRFCKASKEAMLHMDTVDEALLRNVMNYDSDVRREDISSTGIHSECVFNDIPSFHVTSNYAVDVMHDISEGVLRYVMGFIMYYFIFSKKYFTL